MRCNDLQGPCSDLGLDSEEIMRLMRLDEEDDATSPLDESKMQKIMSNGQTRLAGDETFSFVNQVLPSRLKLRDVCAGAGSTTFFFVGQHV